MIGRHPTTEELRAAIAEHLSDPSEQASAGSIARVIHALLARTDDESERCSENGCPRARVEGLESCAEHIAQEIATLRLQVREGLLEGQAQVC